MVFSKDFLESSRDFIGFQVFSMICLKDVHGFSEVFLGFPDRIRPS